MSNLAFMMFWKQLYANYLEANRAYEAAKAALQPKVIIMTGTTTDPLDPRLGHGSGAAPRPQQEVYLVLSPQELAKGFVRPLRRSYIHVGLRPKYALRDLTAEEQARYGNSGFGYVKFEEYPPEEGRLGRFWRQQDLDNQGCGTVTTMALDLAQTYACQPDFYGATYCVGCGRHLAVEEFRWVATGNPEEKDWPDGVGPILGS